MTGLSPSYHKILTDNPWAIIGHHVAVALGIILLQLPITSFVFYVAAEVTVISLVYTYLLCKPLFQKPKRAQTNWWVFDPLILLRFLLLPLLLVAGLWHIIIALVFSTFIFAVEWYTLTGGTTSDVSTPVGDIYSFGLLFITACLFLFQHVRHVLRTSREESEAESYFSLELSERLKVLTFGMICFCGWGLVLIYLDEFAIPLSTVYASSVIYLFSLSVLAYKVWRIDLHFFRRSWESLRRKELQQAKRNKLERYLQQIRKE